VSSHESPAPAPDYAELRARMVREQLAARGIRDARVLDAMGRVPRHELVPESLRADAYQDGPLPIGEGQTISQPYIVAAMSQAAALTGGERVLEVGTGSGYGAAVLAELAREVYTIERHAELAEAARRRLVDEGYARVHVRAGDGTLGWPEAAPFDAIVVTAGGPSAPPSLLAQLAPGGRLVMPIGESPGVQRLVRLRRTERGIEREDLGAVRFVPLIGAEGW
jgi:protein-L-isoaspartate(D-aspartate) O-methyltransferase